MITLEFPFNRFLLKNNTRKIGKYGNYYISSEAREAQNALIMALKVACEGHTLRDKEKVWINIMVYKPDNRSDAINIIDSLMDAIQQATGINDRFYCISQLDWDIDKDNPRIRISIEQ